MVAPSWRRRGRKVARVLELVAMAAISPMLVAMKGHPGCGKSTLAAAISTTLKWPLIDKDDARDCLVLLEANTSPVTESMGARMNALSYEIMWRCAERQLKLGLGVVVDCPLAYSWLFQQGRSIAERCGVKMVIVECVAHDAAVWRRRLEGRAAEALAAGGARSDATFDDADVARQAWAGGLPRLQDLPIAVRWHKYVRWEGLESKLESYGGCWDYDTSGVDRRVVETTLQPLDSILAAVIDWLRQIQPRTMP